MSYVILTSSAKYVDYLSLTQMYNYSEAHDYAKSMGTRSFLFKTRDKGNHTLFEFRTFRDDIHDSISGLYYISESYAVDGPGISKHVRIDFDNETDALLFKLSWV